MPVFSFQVSECHSCECLYGTIVCHQHRCPSLTCVHTVTLSGHCCPICRDQLSSIIGEGKGTHSITSNFRIEVHDSSYTLVPISQARFGLTVIIIFCTLILILILIILILIFMLLHGAHRSRSSANQIPPTQHLSPKIAHQSSTMNFKPSNLYSYVKYDLMAKSNDNHTFKQGASSVEQASTHSMIRTNTTTTGASSSNHELEPGTWTTEDEMILHGSISSGNDVDVDHDISSSDLDESHRQQLSQPQIQVHSRLPNIIYV